MVGGPTQRHDRGRLSVSRPLYNGAVAAGVVYEFGEFALDAAVRRLTRAGQPVPVAERHLDVLLTLLAAAGTTVSKDALVSAAWQDVAVTDNSLEQAVSALRRALGVDAKGQAFIQTVPRQGYKFAGAVIRAAARASAASLEALLAPHRAWSEGRAALETLGLEHVGPAERVFRQALASVPDLAHARIGLANALAFRFEATRADEAPDTAALVEALEQAGTACQLDPDSGEAWATLGFVQHRAGNGAEGRASVRRALSLERDNWRHHLRMAFVSWGEERLRASGRSLQLLPGLALAHWLAASVHIARQSFEAAERELDAAMAAQGQQSEGGRFRAVGAYWLRGLLFLRQGDARRARLAFEQELALEGAQHLYTRECCANAWYALGAIHVLAGERELAARAFDEATLRVKGHPMATAARLAFVDCRGPETQLPSDAGLLARLSRMRTRGADAEVAVVEALGRVASGEHTAAAARVHAALRVAPPGVACWFLPIDPLLQTSTHLSSWDAVLSLLRERAS